MTSDGGKNSFPYGLLNLEREMTRHPTLVQVKCLVTGCTRWLSPPKRGGHRGDVCPDHGIRVHSSGTYSYNDYRRNLIVDVEYFERHIRSHPFKYECHRFGQERSEDAVTWNVFRSLQREGQLHKVVSLITSEQIAEEPRLLLWGLELGEDGVKPWDLLIQARERFESDLPVKRPKTEPDIALYSPGKYLVLIEAKFTSPNGIYQRDRVTKLLDLTIDQLVNIYQDKSLKILNVSEARHRESIHYQLWRNMIFAEWMSACDGSTTKAYHANLVRAGFETQTCDEFLTLIHPQYQDRFEQITWEQIYGIAMRDRGLRRLCCYMEQKTAGLKAAFQINRRNDMREKNDAQEKPKKRSTLQNRMNDVSGFQLIKKDDPRHSEYQKNQAKKAEQDKKPMQ